MAAAFAWTGVEVDSAVAVSWVKNRYFDLSRGHIFDAAEGHLLEGVAEEELEGGVLNDMCMHLEQNISDL